MDREDVSSNVSIADRIWKCLPRRIECQTITVNLQAVNLENVLT